MKTHRTPSGETLYFSHSTFHSADVRGGSTPVKGCHSVMLRPDSVSRVRPPMTRMPKTKAEHPISQVGKDLGIVVAVGVSDEKDSAVRVVRGRRSEHRARAGMGGRRVDNGRKDRSRSPRSVASESRLGSDETLDNRQHGRTPAGTALSVFEHNEKRADAILRDCR